MLLYSRNEYNIVKLLYPNLKKITSIDNKLPMF